MRFLTSVLTAVSVAFAAVAEASCENAPCSPGPNSIRTDLGPRLSPNATIALRCDNSTLFKELTYRYSTVHPQLTAFVSVGAGEDVGEIIKYALETDHQVLAGNRRHGWSESLNRIKDAIMIDISTLLDIDIDTAGNTVTVGGGVNIGEIMAALQAVGKETPTGGCDCVGLLGATLGGGHGRLQGLHGLMIDNLLSAELTIATGETITVSNTSNPELFWGLRGAGQNFGIITEATYRIYDATNGGMQFMADIIYDTTLLPEVFEALNSFDVPAETTILVAFFVDPVTIEPRLFVNFVSSIPEAAARAQLDSVFGHIPYLSMNDLVLPWASANGMSISQSACESRARKELSGVSTKGWHLPSIQLVYEKFAEFVADPAWAGAVVVFESYSVKGVQAVPAETTAYPWRDETGIIISYKNATLDAAADDWVNEIMAILHADSGFDRPAVYMNYAKGTEGFGAVYGYEKWRQAKLKDLKRKWDPSLTPNMR
ncbi:FAD-binding domain-containing protein [Morchella conica CCBAS932]|uniref:FAD-binding domain-containing protein n=1 Tax=Morchella conica CCBAS932 TaxID=1392247 RepID=A0A3N4KJL9_9PEZI|nr:FAD-binding domain-containing protein [Morchella conica CCBAS932]